MSRLRLSHIMRGDDLVARLGGDEFAVITAASADHAALHEIASRMIETLCAPYSISGHTIVIGASIGIAVIDQRAGGSADIMRYADMALYRAKNEGRNRACIYDAVMDADLSQRKLVEQDLRETIENDGLKVFYQPIFNASGDKVVGVEALARWPHPTRGLIPPGRIHPDRRALRPHHRARRQGAAAGLPRRHGMAGHHGFGQRLAAAIPPARLRQHGRTDSGGNRLRSEAARARAHRDDAARQRRKRRSRDAAAQGARRAACARRLRHRLFEPAVSAPLPVRQAQDRPQLRAAASRRRPTPPRSSTPWSASAAASA